MLSRCFLDFSVDEGAFVIGLSQISSFFSYEIQSRSYEIRSSDRPKSVFNSNLYLIELLGDIVVLSCFPFDISVVVRACVIGLSQISSFFLLRETTS